MSEIYYSRSNIETGDGVAENCKVTIGHISKKKLLQLINYKDPNVSLVEPKTHLGLLNL